MTSGPVSPRRPAVPPARVDEIAQASKTPAGRVREVAAALAQRGYVKVDGETVSITESGRPVAALLVTAREEILNEFLESFDRRTRQPSRANGRLHEVTTPERQHELHKTVVVGMGVAGSGKSTIAQLLAQQLGRTSIEGDDLHPRRTLPRWRLEHRAREPWLREISQRINQTEGTRVITCSALRRSYRDILRTADASQVPVPQTLPRRLGLSAGRPYRSLHAIEPARSQHNTASMKPLTMRQSAGGGWQQSATSGATASGLD
jgi:gluconokinase